MQGEELNTSDIGTKGLLGDRTHALWDVETKRVASAKNPREWLSLLNCHATLEQTPHVDRPIPIISYGNLWVRSAIFDDAIAFFII